MTMNSRREEEARALNIANDAREMELAEARKRRALEDAHYGAVAGDRAAAEERERMRQNGFVQSAGGYMRRNQDGSGDFYSGVGYAHTPAMSAQYGQANGVQRSGAAGGARPSQWQAALDAQNAREDNLIYDQMREVQGRVIAAEDEHSRILNDGLVAAMRFSADTENGGRLPLSACQLLTRQLGMDGVKSGIKDAGYVMQDTKIDVNGVPTNVKAGSFGITLATRDEKGNVVYNPVFLSPTDVYAVMNANKSQFSDEQIMARRNALLQSGYSEKELDALATMNIGMNRSRAEAFKANADAERRQFDRGLATRRYGRGLSFEERMDLEDKRSSNRTKEQEARDRSMGGRQDNAAAERRKLQRVRDLGKSIDALRKEQSELDKGTMNITRPEDYKARTSSISEKIASLEKERDSIYSDNDKVIASEGQTASNAGYNGSSDDSAESTDYPGYSNGKAKRALAKGWTWNPDTMRFDPPKGK